jgi:UDP-N-acetylglucosamine:LPS N-acetylglucosamine transferase
MLEERDLGPARLAAAVTALLAVPSRLTAMGQAMATFARPDAARRIVRQIRELAA